MILSLKTSYFCVRAPYFGRFLHKITNILTVFWRPKGPFVSIATSVTGKMTVVCLDQELETSLRLLNPTLTRAEFARAFKAADLDGNGMIDHEEFSVWLRDNAESHQKTAATTILYRKS